MNSYTSLPIFRNLCLLAILLISSISASGQKVFLQGAEIPSFNAQLSTQFSEYQIFQISTLPLASENQPEENFQLQLQLGNQHNWNINLTASQIISPNYREIVGTENGPLVLPSRKNIAYTGYLPGTDLESRLTLDNGWIMGFVTLPDGQKIYIEPLGNLQPNAQTNQYLIYPGNAVLNTNAGDCGALLASSRAPILESHSNDPVTDPVQLNNVNCKEVDFSVASAFDMINTNHNTPQLVMNHIISITNMMQTYFEFVPIQYLLNDNYVAASTVADPFGDTNETNTNVLLPGFVTWAQNADVLAEHDVAQVWTARNIEGCGNGTGLVGCAYINTICNNLRYNICEDYRPNDIKTLSVLSAHELGHNWNCLHSDRGEAPYVIMNGGITSSAIGFGPNSMAKILATANNSACLSGCGGPTPNCTAQSDFPFQEWIEDVTVGTLTNLGSGKFRDYSTAGYSDYTDLVAPVLDRADPVSYVFNIGNSGANPGDYWTAFIDYNQNNIFDLPEERVVQNQGQSIGGEFIIPGDALNGTTLMRIILSKNGFSGPCDNPDFGEVEDYLVEMAGEILPPELPDLAVSALTVTDQVFQDGTADYSIRVSNIGVAPANDFKFGVFVSTDDELDQNDQLIEVISINNLEPFSFQTIESTLDLNGGPVGEYFMFFKVDKEEVIEESQESNNTIRRNLTIIENTDNLIDLELNMTASVPEPDRFTRSRITLTLTNNSTNTATDITNYFRFSPGNFVVAGDGNVAITGGGTFSTISGSWEIPSMIGGGTATVAFDLFTLSDEFNPCAEVVFVDQEDSDSTPGNGQCPNAVEDDEANLSDGPPTEPTIDYVIESLDFPPSGVSNTNSIGDINYGRLGTSTEALRVAVEVYLSADGQLDPNDPRIGSFSLFSNSTASNNTVSIGYDLSGIQPGDYTLIAVFDRTDEIMEVDENNNIATVPFTVEAEEVPDCSTIIGGDEILCSENIGDLTRLYIREGDEYFTADLDMDANVVATSATTPLVYDSTLIQNNVITHKLADGTISFSGILPSAALDFIPNPVAATLLSTGEYLIAGNVPLGEVGQEPYGVETRVLKLNGDLTSVVLQKAIADNSLYPANLNDEVFALVPLADGKASIIYTIYDITATNNSNLQFKELDLALNTNGGQVYPRTFLDGITETPCGDLLLNATLFQISQRGSTVAAQQFRISKDASTINSAWQQGITRTDRVDPRQFAIFQQAQEPELLLSYFSLLDNPPAELIGNLPQTNGDTTQVNFPFFEYNYGTRNENTAILYGNINGQITTVTECEIIPPVEGVDIALNLAVSDSMPDIFSKIFYQVTVINEGTETATGLSIDFDYGAQAQPKRLALVNNPNPDYSPWQGIWTIGTLAPGEARTFELEVFVLPAAGPNTTLIAEMRAVDQIDINPMNNLSLSTIFVDAGATLNEGAALTETSVKGPKLSISNLFPNPATAQVTVAISSQNDLEAVPLQIFDAFGKMIRTQSISLKKGTNLIQLPIAELSEGVYLIVLPTGSHQNLVKRFVKMR